MKKALLERFISKYNLGGSADAVLVTAKKGDGISTRCYTEDTGVVGSVKCSTIELEDGEYGIFDTQQLKSLLHVLSDDITVKPIKTNNRITGLSFSDTSTKVVFSVADKANIPLVPHVVSVPSYEIVITLDQQFINTFVRATSALASHSPKFTVLSDNNKATVVVGYESNLNSNRVAIDVTTSIFSPIKPVTFSSLNLREIFLANKEMTSGLLKITSVGLANVSFTIPDFVVNYDLAKVDI